jgi:type III pantothenate kinase
MMLLVDIGNTRVKWATSVAGRLSPQQAAEYARWDVAQWRYTLFAGRPIRHVVVASVAGSASRSLLAEAAASSGATLQFIASTAQAAGVRNAYPDPSLLGVDRWVAVIGAHHLKGTACCVVDIGTAATVDAVDDDGRHLGGFIVPGPGLMVQSLHSGTSDLAAHSARSKPAANTLFADNTRDAIERGCRVTLAALIDRAFYELGGRAATQPALLGTGGAIDEVARYVIAPLEIVPDLVLHGLARLAEDGA